MNSGGEEFLVELAGQDATEAFEGASHSDGARNILEGLCVGNLKRTVRPLNFHSHIRFSAKFSGQLPARRAGSLFLL